VPDGIGRQFAVLHQLVEVGVAGLVLVEPVGGQQPVEGPAVQAELLHRGRQPDEDLVAGGAGEQVVELGLDPVQRGQAVTGILVTEVVDQPCVAVDGPQVALHRLGQQPQRHREVLGGCSGHDRVEPDMALDRFVHRAEATTRLRPARGAGVFGCAHGIR